MDGFVARRDLIDNAALKQWSSRSNTKGMVQLTAHLAALAVSGFWVWQTRTGWVVLPALLVHGLLLNFLFAALHESIHRTAFRRRWLNDVVARVAGFILLLPCDYFRHFHFAHHRFTQIPEKDPELATAKPASLPAYLWSMSGIASYWWAGIVVLGHHAVGNVTASFIPQRARGHVVKEARASIAGYVLLGCLSVVLGSSALLLLWVVPAVLGAPSLRLFLHAEHGHCALAPQMLENTRTTLSNPLMRALSWNMPYHVEHHLYPSVPFHALPKIYDQIRGQHVHLSPGYAAYHRGVVNRTLEKHRAKPST